MYKITLKLLICLFINGVTPSYGAGIQVNSISQQEVTSVLNNYFNALSNGDVTAIKNLIGGQLLEKRKSTLDNPTYPRMLSNMYKQARYDILDTKLLKNNEISVNVSITLNPNEIIYTRFILGNTDTPSGTRPSLKIIGEQDIPD